jgi:deoxyribodipyrimidine photolyase
VRGAEAEVFLGVRVDYRPEDFRKTNLYFSVEDNRALSQASVQASKENIPLIVLFIISPQDYITHDMSARRIDFTLRNLKIIKASLASAHTPS